MGTPLIMEKGLASALYSCAFLSTENIAENPSKAFTYAMDMLMCGVGVGFDTLGGNKVKVKEPKNKVTRFLIPDSREGWVESLGLLIMSFFGQENYELDYSDIRPEGSPIKTFGGTSSGYKPLMELHVAVKELLTKRIGQELSITDITDIFNLIAKAVVSGNVRRSAEIAIGNPVDEFLNLKNYEINPDREEFGWASNNTIYGDLGMDYSRIADMIRVNGEPGVFWKDNAKKYSRTKETEADYKDHKVSGLNPCVTGDTLVAVADGREAVSFTELASAGRDVPVYAVEKDGTLHVKIMREPRVTGYDQPVYTVTFMNGAWVTATEDHKFMLSNGEYVTVSNLKVGEDIRSLNKSKTGNIITINKVKSVKFLGRRNVYNGTVDDLHNYAVGGFRNNEDERLFLFTANCGEINLEDSELCNLVETFPFNHDSLDDYKTTLKYAYLYGKTITLLNTHWEDTNRVMLRNRRIGLSITGAAQFIANKGINELKKWMEDGYQTVKKYDKIYSDWFAIPQSIKLTTIKPSGTVSLLAGATPGIHYPESVHYIRRVRLGKNSQFVSVLDEAGYKIEPAFGQEDSTVVVEFPVCVGESVRPLKEVSMWEQLSLAAFAQEHWADNSVSVTVTFDPEKEGKDIANALNYYQFKLKAVSLLPRVERGAYAQMPYEEISKETYERMVDELLPLDFSQLFSSESLGEKYCSNDGCEV